ncbi:MAG: DUF3179 domain-containing protein [Pseudomonadota bacterium]
MFRFVVALVLTALTTTMAFADAGRWQRAWPNTDFTKMSVNPFEIFSGGPPKDGIPAITGPTMKPVAAEDEIDDREPVMSVALDGQTPRAYPIRYLMWHEIVNDRIGDVPVAVTFCPLCNSGLVFDLRMDGQELELGVSGMLRHSDMIMYDRQTESWWQQFTGEAIAGDMLGKTLTPLPALLESWAAFKSRHPDGLVMAEPTGHSRSYGSNPYRSYDTGTPFLYRGENPPHDIHPLTRVIRVDDKAWPLIRVRQAGRLEEADLILTWTEGQASALDDKNIAEGREVGNVVVTSPDGTPVVFEVVFAFAFHAFTPDGEWMLGAQ